MQPSTVKRVAKQVLMALEYLHEECGIIHAGTATFGMPRDTWTYPLLDIKHDNILFRPSNLFEVVAHQLTNIPSTTYDCGTELLPTVIPIVSQPLAATTGQIVPETQLEGVLADVGHCTYLRFITSIFLGHYF